MPVQPLEILGAHVLGSTRRHRNLAAYERRPAQPSVTGGNVNLLYLTEGRAQFRFADGLIRVRAGNALIWKGAILERQTDPGRPISYWYLTLVPLGASGIMTLEETGLPRACTPKNRPALERVFSALHSSYLRKAAGWRQNCSVTALKILRALVSAPQGTPADPESADNRFLEKRIGDVLDFINLNYKKRLGVDELARVAATHTTHLTRLFKRATGLTPHRYILEKKVEKAKDFLVHFGESPTFVAMELGFHDYPHFSRVFTKLAGVSPSRFLAKQGVRGRSYRAGTPVQPGQARFRMLATRRKVISPPR